MIIVLGTVVNFLRINLKSHDFLNWSEQYEELHIKLGVSFSVNNDPFLAVCPGKIINNTVKYIS